MMNFCRKFSSINTISDHNVDDQKLPPKSKCYGGLQTGLVTATGDIHRPPNVVESSSVKSSSSSSSSSSRKVDQYHPREDGFFLGENVDHGLMSCTESLGFESSDERRVDEIDDQLLCSKTTSSSSSSSLVLEWKRRRRLERKREEKKFPPPLSSLCENGQPSFYLRPVRKDGRLELSEVRIDRPSVFHAYREDGRLRLHIVNIEEEEEEEEEEVQVVEEENQEIEEKVQVVEEERVVVRGGEWRFEGFRRCHHQNPQSHQHHHHNLLGAVR